METRNYAHTYIHFVYKIMICLYIPSYYMLLIVSATVKETEKPGSEKVHLDPKTCQIPIDQEVTIEFQKEKDQVVGVFIAGGSDTLWVNILDNF